MKLVIQRVKKAQVRVEHRVIGSIGRGLLVFLGVGPEDTKEKADIYIDKMIKLRIFSDETGKTNLSVQEVGGEILLVSQFTLYADCHKGNRPNFMYAAPAQQADDLYQYVAEKIRQRTGKIQTGEFGAEMEVELVNDGPFTIVFDENL